MKQKKMFILEGIEFIRAGARGKAVGKAADGKVVLSSGVVPGDVADVRVIKKKKGHYEAKLHHLITPSVDRIQPECAHFGICGGCKWQNLDYRKQLEYKEDEVQNHLSRIGKVHPNSTLPILASEDQYFYRNKLEFSFSNQRWITDQEIRSGEDVGSRNALGFHIPGMWDKVLDIQKCHLQPDPSNEIRNFVRKFAEKHDLRFFDIREQQGLLRTLMIRTTLKGEVMVVIQFFERDTEAIDSLLSALRDEFPQITSLMYVINQKGNDSIYDQEVVLFHGRDHILEEMPSYFDDHPPLQFKIGPKSFYQTNPKQAYELYRTALDLADLKGGETVYDLYTGTGTIALFLAQKAGKVVGVESVPEAIEDAYVNMEMNGLKNLHFVAGDMKDVFTSEFVQQNGHPDVIITDPPRDGMHKKVVETLLGLAPSRIVYVSCNSATQARDLELMKEKYSLEISRAVDMFPHTHHIENVVLLKRKDGIGS
ncbi:MAG: 23S rRNA (uracil(1939)-C(5))-methyltransferase RlmD [Bacteroidota bacterium]|nr:23S rRNA (uracil(1939)-C(5))-methyltransferase RlmD [Bacteroidota bacterium]